MTVGLTSLLLRSSCALVCGLCFRVPAEAINGFSVSYWGWGQEDDDLYFRLRRSFSQVRAHFLHFGSPAAACFWVACAPLLLPVRTYAGCFWLRGLRLSTASANCHVFFGGAPH